tara:strand:+ start:31 stop:492 length:462 start_codon:yes stop_codon:yes gene_type:complete
MAATEAMTLIHERYQVTSDGRKPLRLVYKLADATQNAYTRPVNLDGAKSVWVATENTAAEFYIPSFLAEASGTSDNITTSTSASGTNAFDTADDTGYMKMGASAISGSAGVGLNVVLPSAAGAGFIGGSCIPPMLSVKVTGGDDKDVYIFVSY